MAAGLTPSAAPPRRRAAWLEGAGLALLILVVVAVGGDTVRASYHGYLHSTLGEAVLRDGLAPENPYHAGEPLRYYTLYPAVGALLGRLGIGTLWGFALLNVLAALLTPVALDALGRACGLGYAARRAAFWALLLGFNALGWVGWLLGEPAAFGDVPSGVLLPMTFVSEAHALGWDNRLQSFLPKYFNATSFVLALPFMLWSLAATVGAGTERERPPWRCVVPAALALAVNPLVGGITGLGMAVFVAPTLLRGGWRQRLRWPAAGGAAVVLALPFLLGVLQPAAPGATRWQTGIENGSAVTNAVGPLVVLWAFGLPGLCALGAGIRWRWTAAVLLAAAGAVVARAFDLLPFSNDYKLVRIAAVLLAVPAGAMAARSFATGGSRRLAALFGAALGVPTLVITVLAYWHWQEPVPFTTVGGRLVVAAGVPGHDVLPPLLAAECAAPADAVVLAPPNPMTFMPFTVPGGSVQGNPLAALLHHPLFVDWPHFHNDRLPDTMDRLDVLMAIYGRPLGLEGRPVLAIAPGEALARVRATLPDRSWLIFLPAGLPDTVAALQAADGRQLAESQGLTLWQVPARGG